MTSHTIPPIAILCIFIEAIQQVHHLERGVDEESNKNWNRKEAVQSKKWCPSHKFFDVLFSVTQPLFLLDFSWRFDNITANNKNSTSKKRPTNVSEITMKYLHKNVIILLLCQLLFVDACVHKILIVSKDLVFYLFWYNVIPWSSHIRKNIFFSLIL